MPIFFDTATMPKADLRRFIAAIVTVPAGGTFEFPIVDASTLKPPTSTLAPTRTRLEGTRIVGTVFSNQSGTLQILQGSTTTNLDSVSSFNIDANTGFGYSVELVSPYIQIKLINTSTSTATVRIFTYLRSI